MLSKLILRILIVLPLLATSLIAEQADPLGHALKGVRFFGRWDLRAPDRAVTVNGGSYFRVQFAGSSVDALFDIGLNQAPFPTIAWRIDDGEWQEAEVGAKIALTKTASSGAHTLWLMVRGLDERQSRWTNPLVASVTFLGLDFPDGGQVLPPLGTWNESTLKLEFLGDSITEGVVVQDVREGKETLPWRADALHSYACHTAMLLGADWRQVGFGATGLAHGGNGGAVPALESLNFFYADCPRDNWQPDLVVVNQGTNDGSMLADEYQALYSKYLAMIRQAYPQAKIAAVRPFIGAQAESIKRSVDAAVAGGDSKVYYVDTTGWYTGDVHPNARSSKKIADRLAEALRNILN